MHGKTKLNIQGAAGKIRVPWLIVHVRRAKRRLTARRRSTSFPVEGISTLRLIERANHGFGATHPLGKARPSSKKSCWRPPGFVRNAATK